jgi:8-oxo-dGTP pyrophosphatase MutT (NUDIX family)
MGGEVVTVYPGQQPPGSWDACLLIHGSAPWPAEAIALLRQRWAGGGRLVVFVAEPDGRARAGDSPAELARWYDFAFGVADVVMRWWPDEEQARSIPASLAACDDGQRMVHGAPPDAPYSRYLLGYADSHALSVATTLPGMISAALGKVGSGSLRTGGEREVPLAVWTASSFQRWYSAQIRAGNTLLGARQVWTFGTGSPRPVLFYWALRVRVYVRAEDRVKSNEVVISRPDISVMALYRRGTTVDEAAVVLIREFRSPAATPDGFVHELPGGSGDSGDARDQAIAETEEETGLAIDVRRIRAHGSRQLAATMSAHHAHLFTAELTSDELARLHATQATPHGAGDTERTWTEVTTFGEIRRNHLVDWATLGMIAEALLD